MSESKVCYIRRADSSWVPARKHHEIALKSYLLRYVSPLEPGQTPAGATICTEHEDGGQFYAYFTSVNNTMYQFLDRYGNFVKIMMETPSRIAHINRITD